ncbi:hypothetical protein MRX96_057435 [Rhipicephalus microplus]
MLLAAFPAGWFEPTSWDFLGRGSISRPPAASTSGAQHRLLQVYKGLPRCPPETSTAGPREMCPPCRRIAPFREANARREKVALPFRDKPVFSDNRD